MFTERPFDRWFDLADPPVHSPAQRSPGGKREADVEWVYDPARRPSETSRKILERSAVIKPPGSPPAR